MPITSRKKGVILLGPLSMLGKSTTEHLKGNMFLGGKLFLSPICKQVHPILVYILHKITWMSSYYARNFSWSLVLLWLLNYRLSCIFVKFLPLTSETYHFWIHRYTGGRVWGIVSEQLCPIVTPRRSSSWTCLVLTFTSCVILATGRNIKQQVFSKEDEAVAQRYCTARRTTRCAHKPGKSYKK